LLAWASGDTALLMSQENVETVRQSPDAFLPGRPRSSPFLVAAAIGLLCVAWLTGCGGEKDARNDPKGALLSAARLVGSLRPPGPQYTIAHVTGSQVVLYDSPDGRVIERASPRTGFGSPRTFLVSETRGDWVGVLTPKLSNGQLGWLERDSDDVAFSTTRFSVHVDLSTQTLGLRYGDDVLHRARVTIGQAGVSTPVGVFAVTDALAGRGLGPWYGCCALAISGHQPNLPAGWVGGNRIAIHGTPGPVGGAASHGCLRTTNEDMVVLFAELPLGAPVFIDD
jgi:hypothetical protein